MWRPRQLTLLLFMRIVAISVHTKLKQMAADNANLRFDNSTTARTRGVPKTVRNIPLVIQIVALPITASPDSPSKTAARISVSKAQAKRRLAYDKLT